MVKFWKNVVSKMFCEITQETSLKVARLGFLPLLPYLTCHLVFYNVGVMSCSTMRLVHLEMGEV